MASADRHGRRLVLRADVFRPVEDGRYPVILTYGVYAKGLSYQEGYPHQWNKMVEDHPEILEGSTNKYQNWEVTDPERWVPHGYVVIRVDSRGAGWSPGVNGQQLGARDRRSLPLHRMGRHPAVEQRQGRHARHLVLRAQPVARRHQAPAASRRHHPVEGQNDRYRDSGYHGGILSEFQKLWAKHQVVDIQYGRGERAKRNPTPASRWRVRSRCAGGACPQPHRSVRGGQAASAG